MSALTEIPVLDLLRWANIRSSQFYRWRERYGKVNEHNGQQPRDHWLLADEIAAILHYHSQHPREGYRRLTYMMNDDDVLAVSPSTVYRVLSKNGLLDRRTGKVSKKGTGFVQPLAPHDHWHIDIAYLNISGTFYYLCTVLDGCSRCVVNWNIRESMTEADIELIIERGREKFPGVEPRIISDNGPQFIAKDFKGYVRQCGMTHVRTSPYYPQSNGKIERWHRTLKSTTIRPKCPQTLEEALTIVEAFVDHYNNQRLHSALDYVTPADRLVGKHKSVLEARDKRLETARERRRQAHQAAAA